MTWIALPGNRVLVNIDCSVFFEIEKDGSSSLVQPRGSTRCSLDSAQTEALQRLFRGDPDPPRWMDHTVPGLAYPNGSDGPWIELENGAVNMALVDTVRKDGLHLILWSGAETRIYDGSDVERIWKWLEDPARGATAI